MQKNSLENLDDENIPLTKTKKSEKPNLKKIRSEKQIEAFNRTMEIRKQKVEQRKQEKLLESAKLLLEKTTLKKDIPSKKITPIEKYTDSYEDDSTVETSSGEDTEEEIIMVKNKSKSKSKPKEKQHKKKPSRKTIIFDSSSESSSDSSGGGSSEEYIRAPKRVSQRVKRKEVIEQPIKQISRPEDFRVYFV